MGGRLVRKRARVRPGLMSRAFARLAFNRAHGEACVPRAVLLSSGAVERLDERTGGRWTSMTGRQEQAGTDGSTTDREAVRAPKREGGSRWIAEVFHLGLAWA